MGQETQVAVFIDYDNIEISVEEAFGKSADVDWARIFQYAGHTGTWLSAPALAFIASALMRALPCSGITMASTPKRIAERIIAD